jgi:hypothetical protein
MYMLFILLCNITSEYNPTFLSDKDHAVSEKDINSRLQWDFGSPHDKGTLYTANLFLVKTIRLVTLITWPFDIIGQICKLSTFFQYFQRLEVWSFIYKRR